MANVKTYDLDIFLYDREITFTNLSLVAVARYVAYYRKGLNFVNYVVVDHQ